MKVDIQVFHTLFSQLKSYPGYNFIGLFLEPESNTQKCLEEETGAKIRVHGTKADTGAKKSSKEIHCCCWWWCYRYGDKSVLETTCTNNSWDTTTVHKFLCQSIGELTKISTEQPSPISVLDGSFYKDDLPPSPMKNISSAFQVMGLPWDLFNQESFHMCMLWFSNSRRRHL